MTVARGFFDQASNDDQADHDDMDLDSDDFDDGDSDTADVRSANIKAKRPLRRSGRFYFQRTAIRARRPWRRR